jgi:hypothetical protein
MEIPKFHPLIKKAHYQKDSGLQGGRPALTGLQITPGMLQTTPWLTRWRCSSWLSRCIFVDWPVAVAHASHGHNFQVATLRQLRHQVTGRLAAHAGALGYFPQRPAMARRCQGGRSGKEGLGNVTGGSHAVMLRRRLALGKYRPRLSHGEAGI